MLHTLSTYLATHHQAIFELLGGAAGISVLLESLLLKLKNKWHIDNQKLSYTFLHVFAVLTTFATLLLTDATIKNSTGIYATLVIAAQTWHRFVVSPAYTKWITPFLEYQAGEKAQTNTVIQPSVDSTVEPEQFLGQ